MYAPRLEAPVLRVWLRQVLPGLRISKELRPQLVPVADEEAAKRANVKREVVRDEAGEVVMLRVCKAEFTILGENVELYEADLVLPTKQHPAPERCAEDRLIHWVANVVRQAMGLPTEQDRSKDLELERAVMAAAAAGQTAEADHLGRELVRKRASAPRMLFGRTGISNREIW
jgi:hypothetical protein